MAKMKLPRGSGGLASSLLKAIGDSEERRKASENTEDMESMEGDVYEYEEGVPEEERGKNKRFDDVDRFEYELPSDFEDEEIDEETAFGGDEDDADIQRLAKKRSMEIDLNSDEDNEDEDEEEEEAEEAEESEDDLEYGEEGEEVDNSFDGFDNGKEEEEEEDEDEDDDVKHQRMIEAVTGKSARGVPDKQGRRGKERVLSEAFPESEFNLNPSSVSASSAITVEDLMTPLHDMAGFGTIRKRMEQLQKRGPPVAAPLPKVIQERLNRRAGYEKTAEDVTKWQSIVKMNREAPSLNFNIQEPAPQLSTAALAANFRPTTDFEKEVHCLLRESQLAEVQEIEAAEALELNKLTVHEVRERQERLAKMRNLLFRHEEKAKRVKKIKSKTFHRLLLKDQKSKTEVDAAIAEADPEAAKAATMKREFKRAQERMTLKHKNSSRWAKRILKRGLKASENDGTRDAIAEQLRTHAALTRKIHSATLSESDDASSESEAEKEDVVSGLVLEGNSRSKVLAKAKVATLKALEDGVVEDLPSSGLFSLPFMARAIEKKKKSVQSEAMAILEQLEQAEEQGNILGLDEDDLGGQNGHIDEATTSGRISFGEAKQANVRAGRRDTAVDSDNVTDEESGEEFVEGFASDTRVISRSSAGNGMKGFSKSKHQAKGEGIDAQNYVRAEASHKDGMSQKGRVSAVDIETVPAKKMVVAVAGNKKAKGAGIDAQNYARAEAFHKDGMSQKGRVSSVGMETVPAKKMAVAVAGKKKEQPCNRVLGEDTPSQMIGTGTVSNGDALMQSTFSDDDSDTDVQGVQLLDASGSQQDLIRRAFAGDDVEAEFEKVKSQALEEEVPQGEGPLSLPGWGQWTHVQQKRSQPAWLVKEQEMVKRKRESILRKRKDATLKHVMISEKQDKKAAKFTSAAVPFPFSSRDVFESSIRLPIGRDFNTDKAYRDMIRPAVIKSAGVIIDPLKLDKSSVKKKNTDATDHIAKTKAIASAVKRKTMAHAVKRKRHQ